MRNFVKFSLLVVLAVSATMASAADLEFHGYARVGLGFNSAGGNQVSFMQSVSGKSKFRLGNEADWVLEPGFTMSFTKLDDKSAWGVHILPAFYRRFNDDRGSFGNDGGAPVSYKEFYFYGSNVPQLGGGEIWIGRRYFARNYLGAINDSFLEAQDGIGAGVNDIAIGPAKLTVDMSAPGTFTDGSDAAVINTDLSIGAHVAGIQTINKDSHVQIWGRVYMPMQKTSGDGPIVPDGSKRKVGYSASAMANFGFGTAGNLTVAGRYDQNAYTDQQDNGGGGRQNLEGDLVYSVNIAAARLSVDALLGYRQSKSVAQFSGAPTPVNDTMKLILAGVRGDMQIAGPFRGLLEVGYDTNKTEGGTTHTLLKVTPCLAISGGSDPWSRPTFRLFYTYASWNEDGAGDVFGAWKDLGAAAAFANKTSGSVYGLQAEGWW